MDGSILMWSLLLHSVCVCVHMPGAEGLVNLGEGSTTELHPQVQDRLSSAKIVIMD